MNRLTPEEIKSITRATRAGEGYNAEFKVRAPAKVKELSQEVCAFANSGGGCLLIGVGEGGTIEGAEINNSKRSAIQDAIREISPGLHAELYPVMVDNKTVWVIEVLSGNDKPYVLSGAIYVREGPNSQKLTTAEEIRSFFQNSNRIYFDAIPCPRFEMDEGFDKKNFKQFLSEEKA